MGVAGPDSLKDSGKGTDLLSMYLGRGEEGEMNLLEENDERLEQEVENDATEGGDERVLFPPPLSELFLHEPLHGVDHPVRPQAPSRGVTLLYTTLHCTVHCTV